METPQVCADDIQDVMELTAKIEHYVALILDDNEIELAMSALISASINSMLGPCESLKEIIFYRNLFMRTLDDTIRAIRIIDPDLPFS